MIRRNSFSGQVKELSDQVKGLKSQQQAPFNVLCLLIFFYFAFVRK